MDFSACLVLSGVGAMAVIFLFCLRQAFSSLPDLSLSSRKTSDTQLASVAVVDRGIISGSSLVRDATTTTTVARGENRIAIRIVNNSTRAVDVELYPAYPVAGFCSNTYVRAIQPQQSKEIIFETCEIGKKLKPDEYLLMDIWKFQVPRDKGWLGHYVSELILTYSPAVSTFVISDMDDGRRVKVDWTVS